MRFLGAKIQKNIKRYGRKSIILAPRKLRNYAILKGEDIRRYKTKQAEKPRVLCLETPEIRRYPWVRTPLLHPKRLETC
jgi:hypothetical protein